MDRDDGETRSASDDDEHADEDEDAAGVADEVRDDLLEGGRQIKVPGAEVPIRALTAIGIFLGVFMVVWLLLWAAGGGMALALGWVLAAPVAGAAVVLYARSV